MNPTIGILGYDFILSTIIVDKIISKTKAKNDQEHIKMNIVINNKLLEKTELEIKQIINDLEESHISYLILTFNNQEIVNIIKSVTKLPIIEYPFDYQKIIKLTGKEIKL